MILFDTSVLSRVFRRRRPEVAEQQLRITVENLMMEENPLGLPGIVLQELLTGIRSEKQFAELESRLLTAFRILHPDTLHHVEAARLKNKCLAKGINVSGPDCLIAVIVMMGEHELFAIDSDFDAIGKIAPLKLFKIQ